LILPGIFGSASRRQKSLFYLRIFDENPGARIVIPDEPGDTLPTMYAMGESGILILVEQGKREREWKWKEPIEYSS
jgi:hypothetical protein